MADTPLLASRLVAPDDVDELAAREAGGTISVSDQRARIRDRCHRDPLWTAGAVGEQLTIDLLGGTA